MITTRGFTIVLRRSAKHPRLGGYPYAGAVSAEDCDWAVRGFLWVVISIVPVLVGYTVVKLTFDMNEGDP